MSGPEALRGLLIYAQEEALSLERDKVAELLALAISELAAGAAVPSNPALREANGPSDRGSGYLQ